MMFISSLPTACGGPQRGGGQSYVDACGQGRGSGHYFLVDVIN